MFLKPFKLLLKLIRNGRPDCFKLLRHIKQSYCMIAIQVTGSWRNGRIRHQMPVFGTLAPDAMTQEDGEFRWRGCRLQPLGFCSGLCSIPSGGSLLVWPWWSVSCPPLYSHSIGCVHALWWITMLTLWSTNSHSCFNSLIICYLRTAYLWMCVLDSILSF